MPRAEELGFDNEVKPGLGLRLGGALAFLNSDTYNDGKAFIAGAARGVRMARGDAEHGLFPEDLHVNEINTLGFWITLWPR